MDFSFALFEPKKARTLKSGAPTVEITPNGRIVFNKKASELLANHTFCMLGYDSEQKALGVLPVNERQLNSFPVRYAAKGAYIGAKKFFKHFDILPPQLTANTPFQSNGFIGIQL
ncbi:Hypothetical protein LUCI_4019 [Lucifera butyrica]|uniref:Uncharacterized protein n=1 Tax=Lucifera butyrica TaxID=1351585 RepID=A0A498RBA4_9FIRM|nr:hypothetical protein [Lucifera butyrica]VBB08741.1 Hypothetical protein LUCI_4019 [Lucifera butyrica]